MQRVDIRVGEPETPVERRSLEQPGVLDLPLDHGAGDDQQPAAGHELGDAVPANPLDVRQLLADAGHGLPGVPENVAGHGDDAARVSRLNDPGQVLEVLPFAV